MNAEAAGCGSLSHVNRRTLLKAAGLSGLCWLTPLAERLARAADDAPRGKPAKSVIVLWMQGGPSQLETFDPHPDPAGLEAAHAHDPVARDGHVAFDARAAAPVVNRGTGQQHVGIDGLGAQGAHRGKQHADSDQADARKAHCSHAGYTRNVSGATE